MKNTLHVGGVMKDYGLCLRSWHRIIMSALLCWLTVSLGCTANKPEGLRGAVPPQVKAPGALPSQFTPGLIPTERSTALVNALTTASAVSQYRLGVGDVIEVSLFRAALR